MRVNSQSKQHTTITNDGSYTVGIMNSSSAASSVAPIDANTTENVSASDSPNRIELLARAQRTLADLAPLLAPLAQLFQDRGHRLYLVGGSVRDALLDELGNDLDFTTDARPEIVMEILNDYTPVVWDTGIDFGTVSAEKDGQQIEITTFRSDVYDGKTRNPEVQFGDTLEGDLIRRDFRVNAMAVEIHPTGEMTFHDPVNGMDDLVESVLDTPSAPEQSFNDDPLRMLRAARFVSQLDFSVADRVCNAMTQMADQIDRITVERVQVELDKLLCGRAPWDGIDLMVDTGLAERIIPEIPALRLTQDEHRQHKDVYLHSLTVLRQAMEQEEDGPDVVLRWASLMHDCGKPDTRAFNDDGKVSFHHHEIVGARIMRARMRTLKYSKQMVNDVSDLIRLHMRFHGFSEGEWTDSAVRRYVTDAGPLLSKLHKLVRADCTTRNKKKAARLQRTYDHLEERIADIAEREDLQRVRPDLDGNEIMTLLDLKPGPDVGKAWSFLKELRLERGPLEREEAIAELKAWWSQNHNAADMSELEK